MELFSWVQSAHLHDDQDFNFDKLSNIKNRLFYILYTSYFRFTKGIKKFYFSRHSTWLPWKLYFLKIFCSFCYTQLEKKIKKKSLREAVFNFFLL